MAIERRVWRLVLAFACLGVLTLALLPSERLPRGVFDVWDKLQHALAFLGLGIVASRAFPRTTPAALAGLALFGGAIELAQWFVGWRSAEWADWGADVAGLCVVAALGHRWRQTRHG